MSIEDFNLWEKTRAREELLKCCSSLAWVENMVKRRPFRDKDSILDR